MAEVYFVRDGIGTEHRTDLGTDVDVKELIPRIRGRQLLRTDEPPIFGNDEVNAYSAFRYVVIKISDVEVGGPFSSIGFYHVVDLSPQDFSVVDED